MGKSRRARRHARREALLAGMASSSPGKVSNVTASRFVPPTPGVARTGWENSSSWAAGTTRTAWSCNKHLTSRPVFSLGSTPIHGGSRTSVLYGSPFSWSLVLAMNGLSGAPDGVFNVAPQAAALTGLSSVAAFPWISVACSDGAAPENMTRAHWQSLVDAFSRLPGRIAVYCDGGHGRTGTALAILASLGGLVPEDACPVEWVRKRYCSSAVETDEQIEYIEAITGRSVLVESSYGQWFGYGRYSSSTPARSADGLGTGPVTIGPTRGTDGRPAGAAYYVCKKAALECTWPACSCRAASLAHTENREPRSVIDVPFDELPKSGSTILPSGEVVVTNAAGEIIWRDGGKGRASTFVDNDGEIGIVSEVVPSDGAVELCPECFAPFPAHGGPCGIGACPRLDYDETED